MAIDSNGIVDRTPIKDKPNEHKPDNKGSTPEPVKETTISGSQGSFKCR